MKKIIISIFVLLISITFSNDVSAASANISVSSSSSKVIAGNNVTITVKVSSSAPLGSWQFDVAPSNNLTFVSSSFGGLYIKDVVSSPSQTSKTYTFVFKAKASGAASVSVKNSSVIGYDESTMSTSNGSASFKITTQAEIDASLSKNNNLKSLSIEGYSLDFSKDKLEYNLEVENGVESLNIIANKEDGTASVSGAGTIGVSEGINAVKVVVTAQNGSSKTYTINVTVKELSPVEVNFEEESYTVVRKKEFLPTISRYYEETTVSINGNDVPAYYGEGTKFTLVALKNKDGNTKLFIYDNGNYKPYNEINFNQLSIYILEEDVNMPSGYKKGELSIGENKIIGYLKDNNFPLVYGLNIETGEKGIYKYDLKENTLQRYEEVSNNEILYFNVIVGLFAFVIVSYTTFLILLVKNGKNNKKIKKIKKEEIETF